MSLVIKAMIIILFILILFSLGSALFFLVRGDRSTNIVKALSWRIGLSLFLFVILLLAFFFGWITPHSI